MHIFLLYSSFLDSARLPLQYAKYAVLFGSLSGLGMGVLQDLYAVSTGHSIKDSEFKRSGLDAFWIPGWDWERGWDGLGVWVPIWKLKELRRKNEVVAS
jgi:hypothetical protein